MAGETVVTDPVPVDPTAPMTVEQGDKVIGLLTDIKDIVTKGFDGLSTKFDTVNTKFDSMIQVLTDIKDAGTSAAASSTSGVSAQQASDIIAGLHQINLVLAYTIGVIAVYFVFKILYRWIGGILFGGV